MNLSGFEANTIIRMYINPNPFIYYWISITRFSMNSQKVLIIKLKSHRDNFASNAHTKKLPMQSQNNTYSWFYAIMASAYLHVTKTSACNSFQIFLFDISWNSFLFGLNFSLQKIRINTNLHSDIPSYFNCLHLFSFFRHQNKYRYCVAKVLGLHEVTGRKKI